MAESEETSEQKSEQKVEEKPTPETGATAATEPDSKTGSKPEAKTESKPEPKPEPKTEPKAESTAKGRRKAEPDKAEKKPAVNTVNKVRSYVATAVWVLAVLAAVILAVGALLVTLDFNKDNAVVDFFTTTANKIDFGVFKEFTPGKGETAQDVRTKMVLVNWGIAAVLYLVGGKILERIIRP